MNIASEYTAHGMALVPIPTGSKGPNNKGWNLPGKVITDPEQAAWIKGNIGIAHAYCQPHPTAALDIDDMVLAKAWLAERGIDLQVLLDAADAVQIVSGRKDRAKLVYLLPAGVAAMTSVAIKEFLGSIMVLELRCGTSDGLTVQDVLPPSIHPDTGEPYQWGGKGNWRSLPEIPDALLTVWQQELVARKAGRACPKARNWVFKGIDDTPRQRMRVADMLLHVSADCSYELYRDMVWAIVSLGWHDGEKLAKVWCLTAPHRFDEDSFWNVANGYDDTRSPTIGTIIYHARAGGWNG